MYYVLRAFAIAVKVLGCLISVASFSPAGRYTALVPHDSAFYSYYPIDWGFNPFLVHNFTQDVLLNHFIRGNIPLDTLPALAELTTLGGRTIKFTRRGGESRGGRCGVFKGGSVTCVLVILYCVILRGGGEVHYISLTVFCFIAKVAQNFVMMYCNFFLTLFLHSLSYFTSLLLLILLFPHNDNTLPPAIIIFPPPPS